MAACSILALQPDYLLVLFKYASLHVGLIFKQACSAVVKAALSKLGGAEA